MTKPVWGNKMALFEAMRDSLRVGDQKFYLLDAAQLVKHAFGLVTDAERKRKIGVLVYLFAEPSSLNGRLIGTDIFARHRAEVARFADFVTGSAVPFHAVSYRDWLSSWEEKPGGVKEHAHAILMRFAP